MIDQVTCSQVWQFVRSQRETVQNNRDFHKFDNNPRRYRALMEAYMGGPP